MNEHLTHARELAARTIDYLYRHCADDSHLTDSDMDTLLDAVKIIRLCDQKEPRMV